MVSRFTSVGPARLVRRGSAATKGLAIVVLLAYISGSPGHLAAQTPPTAPAPATAKTADELNAQWETAVNYFKYQDFDKAVEKLLALLYPASQLDPRRERKAREYLGAAYWWLSKREEAFDQFTALLVRSPSVRLDPAQYPPKMIDDFEVRRRRLIDNGVIKDESGPVESDPIVFVAAPSPFGIVFVPLGVGQFANREPKKGALLLAGQALFGGLSVRWYLANRDAGRLGTRPFSDDALQIGAGAVFWALAAYGVWDAITVRQERWPER